MDLGVGRTLAQFRIVRKLGAGGMGVVYLAQDTMLDRPVALNGLTQWPGSCGSLARGLRNLRELISFPRPSEELEEYARDLATARDTLGDEAYAAAWRQGQALTRDQAIACGLEKT